MDDRRMHAGRWFFYQDTASLWKWAKLDVFGNILAHSGCSFGSREDCVEHARISGYLEEPRLDTPGLAGLPSFFSMDPQAQSSQQR